MTSASSKPRTQTPKEPGEMESWLSSRSLAKVAARFSEAGVNVRSLHILQRSDGESLVSLVTDDNDAARELARDLMVG